LKVNSRAEGKGVSRRGLNSRTKERYGGIHRESYRTKTKHFPRWGEFSQNKRGRPHTLRLETSRESSAWRDKRDEGKFL